MKKIFLLLLTASAVIVLTGCSSQSNNKSDSSSNSSSAKSNSSSSSSSATTKTVQLDAEDSTRLLTNSWKFDQFSIDQIKAEAEDGVLELEINWKNASDHATVFDDIGKVTVSQNGKELSITEQDDDYNDSILPNKTEDFELSYRYAGVDNPIKVSIHPTDTSRPTRTVTVQLKN